MKFFWQNNEETWNVGKIRNYDEDCFFEKSFQFFQKPSLQKWEGAKYAGGRSHSIAKFCQIKKIGFFEKKPKFWSKKARSKIFPLVYLSTTNLQPFPGSKFFRGKLKFSLKKHYILAEKRRFEELSLFKTHSQAPFMQFAANNFEFRNRALCEIRENHTAIGK